MSPQLRREARISLWIERWGPLVWLLFLVVVLALFIWLGSDWTARAWIALLAAQVPGQVRLAWGRLRGGVRR